MGHDEQPLPLVRRADFFRREQASRNAITHALQAFADLWESQSEVSSDVLEEQIRGLEVVALARLELADDPRDDRPEVTWVAFALALPRVAERLARVASDDAIHESTPASRVEGSRITPHRSRHHGACFHRLNQTPGAECVSLNMADDASAWNCQLDAESEGVDGSGADREDAEGMYSHTHEALAVKSGRRRSGGTTGIPHNSKNASSVGQGRIAPSPSDRT